MLILDLSPNIRRHLSVALSAHMRQLHRDRVQPPPELVMLAETLKYEPARDDDHEPVRDQQRRGRYLAAQRSARYRARRRGEPVPLRRPGPPADRDRLGLAG